MPFVATWMDLEIIILSEISQTEKDKYHMISLICGIQKRYKWIYLQNRNILTDIENKLMNTKGNSRHQFSSVAQLYLTFCDSMYCSMPGLPVHHQLPEFTQARVHLVSDVIEPSHPLSSPFPPAFNLSQHQGLFKWVSSSHQVARVLEFQLQHQSFQWIFRTDFL